MLASNLQSNVELTLSESFVLEPDGFWYPKESGFALVRIEVSDREYRIFRRRYRDSAWMCLVEAQLVDFNPGAFREWSDRWPLVSN